MLLYNVRKKSNKGFTLVEMIVTVIIVGVIASIAAPNFLGLLYQSRVKDGLAQVEGAVKEAQKQAIRKGRICKIRFTSSGTGADERSVIQVHPDEIVGATTVSYAGCLLSNRELPDSISFSLLNSVTSTLDSVDSSTPADLGFSTKGNPDFQGTMVIQHPQVDTVNWKCIQIEGLLGSVLTGDYNSGTDSCVAR
jgi:prepilin-type N-terminal cleavage/methylation domain-containing protein